jgi:hypothetical protein
LDGLERAARLVDAATMRRLTRDNPLRLVLGK